MDSAGKIKGTIRIILPFLAAWASKRILLIYMLIVQISSIISNSPKSLLICTLLGCSDRKAISGLAKFIITNLGYRTHQRSIVWLEKKEMLLDPSEGRAGGRIEEVAEVLGKSLVLVKVDQGKVP